MDNGMFHYQSYLYAHACAEKLLICHAIKSHCGRESTHYIASAKESLAQLADSLGFDLVKREPVKTEEAA